MDIIKAALERRQAKIAEDQRRWREANKSKIAEDQRRWREANKSKIAEDKRRYYQKKRHKKILKIFKSDLEAKP